MSTVKEAVSSTVPNWCNKYFSSELNALSKELDELNEQVREAQSKIKEVESRVSMTKGMRNTLLGAQGAELIEACEKVFTMLGWKVKVAQDDKQELILEGDSKGVSIARIIWTEARADRTHVGQLVISQTRYHMEQDTEVEPKGILVVSKTGDTAPTAADMSSEVSDYAAKKGLCLITTVQLLAIYREIALKNGNACFYRLEQNTAPFL